MGGGLNLSLGDGVMILTANVFKDILTIAFPVYQQTRIVFVMACCVGSGGQAMVFSH